MNILEQKVRNLTSSEFNSDNTLKYKDCILVLFYNDINQKDQNLAAIWQAAARSGSIANFAAVNLRNQPTLNFFPQDNPVIVVYRNQHPETFYHGPHKVQDIIDYALTLACNTNFYPDEGLRKYSRSY